MKARGDNVKEVTEENKRKGFGLWKEARIQAKEKKAHRTHFRERWGHLR